MAGFGRDFWLLASGAACRCSELFEELCICRRLFTLTNMAAFVPGRGCQWVGVSLKEERYKNGELFKNYIN